MRLPVATVLVLQAKYSTSGHDLPADRGDPAVLFDAAGRAPMDCHELLRGFAVPVGDRLS
jgi:hypothetical protein